MRIWHEKLIPILCRQHLLAVWREGLGCLKIIAENKKGYRNHPAVKEFEYAPDHLIKRLCVIRLEMLKRGYKPKPLPRFLFINARPFHLQEWQSLAQQKEILKNKPCNCKERI